MYYETLTEAQEKVAALKSRGHENARYKEERVTKSDGSFHFLYRVYY